MPQSLPQRFKSIGQFILYAGKRFVDDGGTRMAASLSYTSLLSLVPLLAIALAMLAAFPVFNDVRTQLLDWIIANLAPGTGDMVAVQLNRFIANAGKLTAAGTIGLAFTAIMLLVTIEDIFNFMFRVGKARTWVNKLMVYWTALTLGPMVMGVALSLQGYLTAANKWQLTKVAMPYLLAPLPTLLTVLAFTGMFVLVPNRRVRLKDALIGAVIAALLFAALRWGFGFYLSQSKAYSNLYGAVAVVPIFLFWMYLCWAVVLLGAEVAAALPEYRAGHHFPQGRADGSRRLTVALDTLYHLQEAARSPKKLTKRELNARLAVPEQHILPVMAQLGEAGFIATTKDQRVVLTRDLADTPFQELVRALHLELSLDERTATKAPWRDAVVAELNDAVGYSQGKLARPIKDVLATRPATGPKEDNLL